jgi:type VI protein secretion system component Hcp
LLGIIALGLAWTAAAQAQSNIFLTWPGITGPSTTPGHVGDIELTSYSQNASNNLGHAVCGAVTVMKLIDSTSPDFLGILFSGSTTSGPVTVTFTKPVNRGPTTFYTVSLRNVMPISITQSDSPPTATTATPIGTIVFSATQFLFTYTPILPNGSPGTPVSFGWDCGRNVRL